jgi:hypothetical protein
MAWKHAPIIPLIQANKSTHTFLKLPNTPMYTTKGYVNTLMMQLNLVPFAINGIYEQDHG